MGDDYTENEAYEKKMYPHEFLYLLENAMDRLSILQSVKSQQLNTKKIDIGTADGMKNRVGDGLRWRYEFD